MNESYGVQSGFTNATFDREDLCVCQHIWGLQFGSDKNEDVFSEDDFLSLQLFSTLDEITNGTAKVDTNLWYKDLKLIVSYATLIIGLPANILILFITAYNWRTKSASSWLVLNLAIADLCLIASAFSTILKASKQNRTINGSCKYDYGCPHFFACVSFISISAIAFDRFYAIVRAGVGDNHGYRYSMIFGTVWTLSLVLTFPMIYFAIAVEQEEDFICIVGWTFLNREQCFEIMNHPDAVLMECPENENMESRCEIDKYFMEKIYYATFTIIGFILPIIVIITSYYFIMQKVHKSRIQIKKIGTKNDGGDSRKNFNRTIMIFFVATLICLLPYISYQMVLFYQFKIPTYYCEMFKNISQSFLILSPILNAVLYSFLGRKFREECLSTFTRIFGLQKHKRNPTLATDSTAFSGRHSASRYSKSFSKQESTRISSTPCTTLPSTCDEQA